MPKARMKPKHVQRRVPSESAQKGNPFEARWTKTVTARARREARDRPPGKNIILDRRIGEKDPTLPEADRYLFRLQRERTQRQKRAAKYNLQDDDEYATESPTRGEEAAVLNEPDRLSDAPLDSDEDLEDGSDNLFTRKEGAHTRDRLTDREHRADANANENPENDEEAPRTRREIMEQVVQKSKEYKAQRQWQKHETDEQTARLDTGLQEIMTLLQFENEMAPAEGPSVRLGSSLQKRELEGRGNKQSFQYESVYQMLASEKRALPTDRLPTEEEVARKERDRLVKMERLRKTRMQTIDEPDGAAGLHKEGKRRTGKGADDLDDSFEYGEDDEEEDSDDEDEEAAEESAYDTDPMGSASDFWKEFSADGIIARSEETVELPYAYTKCPASIQDLAELFKDTTAGQRGEIISRLRKCFALTLDSGRNRKRLNRLLQILLFWLERVCELNGEHIANARAETDVLLTHVHALGALFEKTVFAWARALIVKCERRLLNCWSIADVLVLRCVVRLFPSSDLRHSVMTPVCLLLSDALCVSRMVCVRDVALGVFVAQVLMEAFVGRCGYSPELVRFIGVVLSYCCGDDGTADNTLSRVFSGVRDLKDGRPALRLSDCEQRDGRDNNDSALAGAVVSAVVQIAETVFDDWVPHADIALSHVKTSAIGIPSMRRRMQELLQKFGERRDGLTLYDKKERRVVKVVNPKVRNSETGVFYKRGRARVGYADGLDEKVQAAKRVKRALKKEVRGLARDVRKEAAEGAEVQRGQEDARRERAEKKGQEARAFFEHQKSTWRAAEKKQKKLSGKRW